MNHKKIKVIVLIAAFAMCFLFAALAYDALSKETAPSNIRATEQEGEIGPEETSGEGDGEQTKAPDFTMLDADGNAVSRSDLEGKPLVLNFWASWCPPCKSEMPEFDKVWGETGDEVGFAMVDLVDGQRETVETGSAYAAEQGFSFPVYYDTEQAGAIAYGVTSIPTTYFIDKDGYIVAAAQGAIDEATLREGIGMITDWRGTVRQ